MQIKRIVRKAAVLGSSAALAGATLVGAFAYDLAQYPAHFISNGAFDGTIVIGERAATADVLGAVDIAASLQAQSVTEKPVEVPGQVGEVNLEGDVFKFETSSDLLEMREPLGAVADTLTDSELEALQGGSITTNQGNTDYHQYLRFGDNSTNTLQPIAVNYAQDSEDNVGDFLVVDDNHPFFEWEGEFTQGLQSEIDTAKLKDLEDESFNIFGSEFTFVDSSITTSADDVTLDFMAGQVADTLREGETRTYSIDGTDYEVTLVFVSDPNSGTASAKFSVNGELTDSLQDGETDTLSGGLQIGVRDLLVNSREGVASFFLGADKIEFTDTDYTNTALDGTAEVSNENIEDADLDISGSEISSTKFQINNIKYRLTADAKVGSTMYVPAGHGVREFLDEPQGLLSPTFDIRYEGLTDVATHEVALDSRSKHSYEGRMTNLRGKEYKWPLLTTKGASFKWGDDNDDFWFTEPTLSNSDPTSSNNTNMAGNFTIGDNDYFLVSENAIGSASEKDNSAVLRYEDIDTSDHVLTFTDLSTGESIETSYTVNLAGNTIAGIASNFVVEGQTHKVWISNATGYPLMIDLDGNGSVNGAQVGFTVKGGATVDFDTNSTAAQVATSSNVQGVTAVFMSLAVPANRFDDSSLGGDSLTWNVDENSAGDELTIGMTESGYSGPHSSSTKDPWGDYNLISPDDNDDHEFAITDFGAMVDYYSPSGSAIETLTIDVPEAERGAQVFVTAGTVTQGASGGAVTSQVVNPIAVGLAVLDRDAPAIGSDNLIVVGGPCANTVAAALLGNPANCAEGFEPGRAVIKAWDKGDTVAILVAGYEAQETQGASRVLANYADYPLEGSEVEVVVADLNSIDVQQPSAMSDESSGDAMADENATA